MEKWGMSAIPLFCMFITTDSNSNRTGMDGSLGWISYSNIIIEYALNAWSSWNHSRFISASLLRCPAFRKLLFSTTTTVLWLPTASTSPEWNTFHEIHNLVTSRHRDGQTRCRHLISNNSPQNINFLKASHARTAPFLQLFFFFLLRRRNHTSKSNVHREVMK